VVTLQNYIGIGSFFVMLPSYWRTLSRWTEHTPLWALNARPAERMTVVNQITRRVTRKVKWLAGQPERERVRLGLPHLVAAIEQARRSGGLERVMARSPDSARLAKTVLALPAAAGRHAVRRHRSTASRPALAAAAPVR
jgi:hypothetical protein